MKRRAWVVLALSGVPRFIPGVPCERDYTYPYPIPSVPVLTDSLTGSTDRWTERLNFSYTNISLSVLRTLCKYIKETLTNPEQSACGGYF